MEGPERRGAGPEATGIEYEQLSLFDDHDYAEADALARDESVDANEPAGVRRLHALGHRPDRLHTSDHPGARGDRLEGICRRRPDREH